MKRSRLSSPGRLTLAVAAILLGAVGCEVAADEQSAAPAPEAGQAAEPSQAEPPVAAIPDGGAAEILAFIEETINAKPEGDSDEEQLADAVRRLKVIVEAAARAIDADPTDEQLDEAHNLRLRALESLNQLGDADAAAEFSTAVEAAMAHPRPQVAMLGWQNYLYPKFLQWRMLDDAAKDALAQKILDQVTGDEPSRLDVVLLYMVASNLDHLDDEFAAALLTKAVPKLKESTSQEVQEALAEANLEGKLRRYQLPGQKMEVFGELLGGGEIDWDSYRGKVVLVDFSATWCPGCVEEAPNVVDMYNKYRDKGFDVVAVSLDRTPEAAQRYVDDNNISWATLFPSAKEDRYWNHPLVEYYGIGAIPAAILVDKEGRVVDMDARAGRLRQLLAELLGEPGNPAQTDEAAAEPAEAADASGG